MSCRCDAFLHCQIFHSCKLPFSFPSAGTKYYLCDFCSASHLACDRWNAFTCNYTCIVASYWITLIRYWFASPNKCIARRMSMACQRQCNRFDIESNRVEKEQQSIRKMIMKNEHDTKVSGAEEKRNKKNAGNEQHYFCLNEKQSHRGSLRLRDATATPNGCCCRRENQRNDTLHSFAITKNPKCKELVCFCWSSSVHVKPYHFLPCIVFSSTERKQIALNVVSASTIRWLCRRRTRARNDDDILSSVLDLAKCERINQKRKSIESNNSSRRHLGKREEEWEEKKPTGKIQWHYAVTTEKLAIRAQMNVLQHSSLLLHLAN